MIPHKIRLTLVTFLVLALIPPYTAFASKGKYGVTCKSVIFSNSTKVKRLYGKNVHARVLPASTAKVMTALIVMERLKMDQYVTVSSRATLASPTKLNLQPG